MDIGGSDGLGDADPAAEAALFRDLAENIQEVFWLVDWSASPKVLYVSPGYEKVWGQPREKLYHNARGWLRSIHPEDRRHVLRAIKVFLTRRKDVKGYYRIVRPDGSVRWIWHQTFHVRGGAGPAARAVGLGLDVTDQKEAERELRLSHEVLRQLPDAVIVSDLIGTIQQWLGKAECTFGYAAEEILGRHVSDLYAPASGAPSQAQAIQEQLDREGKYLGRLPCVRKDGAEIVVETISRVIKDQQGQPYAIVSISRDVTAQVQQEREKRELEHRLLQAQKTESLIVLAGGVAHDFNNILAGILGNVEIALQSLDDVPTLRDTLQDVLMSVRRASDLASQMLAYAGRSLFSSTLLDLGPLVQRVTDALGDSMGHCAIHVEVSGDLPRIWGEEAQLRQLLVNLIMNASESFESEGEIRIRIWAEELQGTSLHSRYLPGEWRHGLYVCLEVIDDGCGIEGAALERLFDPFFTTKFTGRGLGLAAVLGIVRRHGGLIDVESRSGAGTRVFLAFPVPEESIASDVGERPRPQHAGATGKLILFADDDEQVRSAFSRLLQRRGYQVLEAEDGSEAVDLFRQRSEEVACILLDLSMPRMDGWQALRRIRELDSRVPIILASGYSEQVLESPQGAERVDAFLHKPFQLDELLTVLKRLMPEH